MARGISVVISGNAAPLRKAIGQANKSLGDLGKGASLAMSAAAVATTAFAYSAIQDAADLGETLSKVGVLFGNNADQIEKFANSAASSLGLSKQAALDGAATFATFGKSAGLSGQNLADFSTEFLTLAGDLASFNNASPQETIAAIGSALRGEAEPLRRFGVLLDDATLRESALKLGIVDTTKNALTPQQKVLAAQAVIFAQTSSAQGDFARTSESLSNQQKILKASLENVKTEIGTALAPALEALLPMFQTLANFASNNAPLLGALAVSLTGIAVGVIAVNGAIIVFKAAAVIATGINYALATSFTAVQVSTGIGIVTAIAGAAAFVGIKVTMDDAAKSAKGYDVALQGTIATQEELNAYIGPVPSRDLATFAKFYADAAAARIKADSAATSSADKQKQKLDELRSSLKNAQSSLRSYVEGIRDAVTASVSLSSAFSDATDQESNRSQAVSDALQERREAYTDLHQARATENTAAYADALDRVASAENKVKAAQDIKTKSYGDIFREQIAAAKEFGGNLQSLIKAGLGKAGLAQLLNLGPVAGNSVAKDLLAGTGGLTVSGLNEGLASVAAAGTAVGMSIPGVSSALGATVGNTYQITIQAGVGDPVAIGKEVAAVLNSYGAKTGGVPLVVKQPKAAPKKKTSKVR
jgi:hypothetical protein